MKDSYEITYFTVAILSENRYAENKLNKNVLKRRDGMHAISPISFLTSTVLYCDCILELYCFRVENRFLPMQYL